MTTDPSSDVMERVARALFIARSWQTARIGDWDCADEDERAPFYKLATAAIAAMPTIERLSAELERVKGAATALQQAEATYRYAHDILGSGAPETGRAWDLMRRAGDTVRDPKSSPVGSQIG